MTDVPPAQPYSSLEPFRQSLPGARIPDGAFDPAGPWTHRYGVWIVPKHLSADAARRGELVLQRKPAGTTRMQLDVDLTVELDGIKAQSYHHGCRMNCRRDTLSSPLDWRLRTSTRRTAADDDSITEFSEGAEAVEGGVRWRGRKSRTRLSSKPMIPSWALFDAVQRLPRGEDVDLDFDMLDETDLYKPDQRLCRGHEVVVSLGGKATQLQVYEQLGTGILPWTYWVDEQRRLAMMIGFMRAYVLEASEPAQGGTL